MCSEEEDAAVDEPVDSYAHLQLPPGVKRYFLPEINPKSDDRFRLFPALDDDNSVYFHGTSARNLEPIFRNGFQPPTDTNRVQATCFGMKIVTGLHYAVEGRGNPPEDSCVIIVRYPVPLPKHIEIRASDISDALLDPQPTIIGFMIIPATYQHR